MLEQIKARRRMKKEKDKKKEKRASEREECYKQGGLSEYTCISSVAGRQAALMA